MLGYLVPVIAEIGITQGFELAMANRGGVQMYPTDYAKTNLNEDFAESMAMFLIDRRKLKEIAPNRERYLHDLSKQFGDRLRY